MKYKRGLLIMLLTFLSITVLFACKKSDGSDTDKEKDAIEETVKSKKKRKKGEKESKKSKKDENEDERELSGIPHFELREIYEGRRQDEGEGERIYYINNNKLILKEDGEEFAPLIKALEKYNKEVDERITEKREYLESTVSEEMESRSAGYKAKTMTDETETYIMRADETMVSLLNYTKNYNGAKTNYSRSSYNIDTETGKKLEFRDVVKDDKTFFKLVDEAADEDYIESNIKNPSEYTQELKEDDYRDLVWTVNPEGVTVYFDTGVLGSYTDGPQTITVYFEENKDIFEPKYVNKKEEYIFPIMVDTMKLYLDIDGDGKREAVYVEAGYEQDTESMTEYQTDVQIFAGEGKTSKISCYREETYIVKKDDKYYMYLFDDDEVSLLYVLDLANLSEDIPTPKSLGVPGELGPWEEDGYAERYEIISGTITDTKSFMLSSEGSVLGTMYSDNEYFVGEDVYPKPHDERGRVTSKVILHTVKNVKCSEVDENGKVKNKLAFIPNDSYILPVYSDSVNRVDVIIIDKKYVESDEYGYFWLKDDSFSDYSGDCYRITVEGVYGEENIDGVNVYEIFEGINFAG